MNNRLLPIAVAILFLLCFAAGSASAAADARTVVGPYNFSNLTVYVVRGADLLGGRQYLTLKAGMAQKKVIARDGQTAVENNSDQDLYIQSGEIVRGGCQDRTIGDDMVVSAHSSATLELQCVEHDRSGPRGREDLNAFGSSENALSSRALRQANYDKNQEAVWDNVDCARRQLATSLGAKTVDGAGSKSLELAFDDPQVTAAAAEYEAAIGKTVHTFADAVGFFYYVNGELCSGDVYASPGLFSQMCPKLLHAAALEALAKRYRLREGAIPSVPQAGIVEAMLKDADAAADSPAPSDKTSPRSTDRTRLLKRQTRLLLVFQSNDTQSRASFLHRAYVSL